MTRSKSKKNAGNARGNVESTKWGVEFVNIRLTEGDIEAIEQLDLSVEDVYLELERLADSGYKVSLSYDTTNNCGIASITGQKGCTPDTNAGKCITSRGPDVRSSCLVMLYKLRVYCVDDYFPLHEDSDRPIWQ